MDLDRINILKAITRRMDYAGERQRVLSENIANADTPGYKPKDLKPASFAELVHGTQSRTPLKVTAAGHLPGLGSKAGEAWKSQRAKGEFEVAPNGNAVNLEQQMMMVAENQSDHNTMANLYRKQVGLIRKAISRTN